MAGREHGVVEGPDPAGLAARVFGAGIKPWRDHHRLARDRRLAGHIDRIRRHDDGLRHPEHARIDIRLVLARHHHPLRRQRGSHPLDHQVRRPPRGHGKKQRAGGAGEIRQPVRHAACHRLADPVAAVVAAEHHRHRHAAGDAKPARRHLHHRPLDVGECQAIQRSGGDKNIRAARAVMARHDKRIEHRRRQARVLDLDDLHVAAAGAGAPPQCQRIARHPPAAGHQNVRVAAGMRAALQRPAAARGIKRQAGNRRGQPRQGADQPVRRDREFVKRPVRPRALHGRRQGQCLKPHAGRAVAGNPDLHPTAALSGSWLCFGAGGRSRHAQMSPKLVRDLPYHAVTGTDTRPVMNNHS